MKRKQSHTKRGERGKRKVKKTNPIKIILYVDSRIFSPHLHNSVVFWCEKGDEIPNELASSMFRILTLRIQSSHLHTHARRTSKQ